MKKSLRRLNRLELVELIYQLRKENLAQQQRCQELESQLQKTEAQLQACLARTNEDALGRIEGMIAELCSRVSTGEAAEARRG